MKKTKRILSFILVFCMFLTLMPDSLVYASEEGAASEIKFSGGTGTETDPYIIKDATDFIQLATDVNGGTSYEGTYFKVSDEVTEPIALSTGDGFAPIGKESNSFKGTFDGNEKTVALDLDLSTSFGVGLFGYCGSGSVIKNVTTTGTVKGTSDVAGIAGNARGKIINCHNGADVTGSNIYVGGISGSGSSYVINCSNSGAVNGKEYVGGIIGNMSTAYVINCLNTGSVTGKNYTGGIAGDAWTDEITNCVNNGKVNQADGSSYTVGGIAGAKSTKYPDYLTITNCYYNSTLNPGICDVGHSHEDTSTPIKDTTCAVSGSAIVSNTVLDSLNVYADKNTAANTALLYWKAEGSVISLTSESQTTPYTITNNSTDCLIVNSYAKNGDTVTVTVNEPAYLTITGITVKDTNGTAVDTTKTAEGYTFTMPESDVTISATTGIKLTQTDGVYQINSADEMKILSDAVNNGYDTKDKSFKLTSNVSLSTAGGFEPIGTYSGRFNGTFDGNGKTVTLDLDITSTTDYAGLFGYCDGGSVIKNVTTTGTVKGKIDVGGIVGYLNGGDIINCHNGAAVTGGTYVGGMAGEMANYVDIINCLNTGSVTGKKYTGGFAGYVWSGKITNCVNNAAVNKADGSEDAVGGIVGLQNTLYTTITNCYYNKTINAGVYDAVCDQDGNSITTEKFAVSGSAIVSNTVLDSLNVYADKNTAANTALLYWKAEGSVISLTSESQTTPYTITNNSTDCLIVNSYAKNGDTVTVTVNEPAYLTITGITVKDTNGTAVDTTKTAEGYTFTMPESDVTISATTGIKLTQTDGVYQINSADEMKILSDAVNNGYDTKDKSFKLTSNVSLSSADGFAPIGKESNSFNGTFDGNEKTVALDLDLSTSFGVGLFGYCGSGSVIKNVTTTGTVKGTSDVAGIAGNARGKIINCHNGADVTGSNIYVGGISGSGSSYVINCSNSGAVNGKEYVGGIIGNMSTAYVINCLNTGSVTGKNYTGGIAGDAWTDEITNCVNNGKVNQADGSSYAVGGIAGAKSTEHPDHLTITNCYYNSTLNPGICDVGHSHEDTSTPIKDTTCAVSGNDLVSDTVLDKLNIYADKNTVESTALLYWKVEGSVISLTSEKQPTPYTITNNSSDCLSVDNYAKNGKTVAVTVNVPEYLTITGITVKDTNGTAVDTTKTGEGYTFTMPESDVTISAIADIKLTKTDGVYQIGSADEMKILSNAVKNGYKTTGKNFQLTENVSLSSADGFAPIGKESDSFNGTFDGNGKTVTLDLDITSTTDYAGLFGYCGSGSVIKNVTTTGTVKGKTNVGGIVGYLSGGNIINCHNGAAVTGGSFVGGLIGNMRNSTNMVNCLNTGSVTGKKYTGGFAGYVWSGKITNCVNNAAVNKADGSEDAVGGIVGMYNNSYTTMTNCYYNETKNEGVFDAGYDKNDTLITTRNCAVSGDDLVSDTVLDKLNIYANNTNVNGTKLLYWKAEGSVISLTSEKQTTPYTITNDSDYLTVAGYAKAGTSVEITVGEIPSYMKIVKITVNGDELTANEAGKYVFTMPEQNVTVDALVELQLTKLQDGSYAISTAEELMLFAKAVNSGDYNRVSASLTANIEVSTANGFVPIGTKSNPYGGDFNGKGHTLTLDITEGSVYGETKATGLFGVTEYAYVYDLILKGSVDGGNNMDSYTGALIGVTGDEGATYVYNVYSETAVSGSGYVGGIIGKGNDKLACLRNVINNGTVTQKNTADDKKAVGAIMGIGTRAYINVYYNSEKSSGMYDCGYSNDGAEVTSDDSSVMAKTAAELFTDEVMDVLNVYSLEYGKLMFWDISADTQKVKFVETCPVSPYKIAPATDLSRSCISVPEYSRAGKTITVKTNLDASFNDYIKSITGIKVTDSSGTVIAVTDKGDDTYEFVMPKKDVKIQAIFEYNINTDSDGVYCIENVKDLVIFSKIVEEGQTDANAKVTADTINAEDLLPGNNIPVYALFEVLNGLIGKETTYKGTFDGNGATIVWCGALFSYTDGAVIKNLNITTYVKGSQAGGFVYSAKDSKITNCSVTASGSADAFGGVVLMTQGNTVIANCSLCESKLRINNGYGGIVYWAQGETEIYNCVNQDLFDLRVLYDAGMIVGAADMSRLKLANNFYYKDAGFYDVAYDYEENDDIDAMTDENSAVDEDEVGARYIPAKLNEYIEENPDFMEGTALNKWSSVYNDETGKDVICFADKSHPEIYSIKQSGIMVNTLVNDNKVYGAVSGAGVTIAGVPSGAAVKVTDENGSEVEITANGDTYGFTMPEGDVTVSVTMDSGIEETTEIDGKTYVVVKTAGDFIKAVTSIAAGNNVLNVQIAGDITLTAAELADYPEYTDTTPAYNATFDGAGHTVTINGLAKSMLATVGEKGIVKNLTVAGTNSSEDGAVAVALINTGTIMNCINKVNISGDTVAGITFANAGTILNCINKGNINGSTRAAAMAVMNQGTVSFVANEGKIEGPSGSSKMIAMGNAAKYDIDLSSEADSSLWKVAAASLNGVLEEGKADTSLLNDCREWSVPKTDTSTELVFADEENAPYYMCKTPDGNKPYQAGSTVKVTIDSADIPDGFIIGSVVVKSKYGNDKLEATPVAGEDNTFSFTMPGKTCTVVVNTEASGLQKDDNGYYLVGSLDDLKKVKKTIEYGNNEINVKLTADIDGYDGTPIGDSDGYSGTFDGNGHSITLAMSDDSGDYDYYGLFETLNSASVVKKLTIKGSIEANASSYVGAVAGRSYGTVTDCVNNAAVTNNSDYEGCIAGGIVGCSEGVKKNPAKLSNCVNNGDVIGYDVGGIVAVINNYSAVTNCKNNGAVTATDDDAGGIVAQGTNVEIINCINTGDVSGYYAGGVISYPEGNSVVNNCLNTGDVFGYDTSGGIVGYGCDATSIKNCFNSGNVTGDDDDVYAIAYYDSYNGSDSWILNSFYLQTDNVNVGLKSSNLTDKKDSSKAVTETEVSSGYVAYRLRSGQEEDETVFWGQTLSGDNADAYPVLGGKTVYRNETYEGCVGKPGEVTYSYSNKQEEKVYAPHDYVNGVCSVCDAIWEETVNGITYQTITEEVDGKPVGKLVTVSGKEQVAVRLTGTGEDFSDNISDGKVTIPSEVTGSDSEQTFVVTEISKNAFSGADVTEIVVPDTVKEVGTGAFGGVETVTFKGIEPPAGIKDALSPNATVNVPEGAEDNYRKALGENANIVEIHKTHTKDEGTRVEPTCEEKGSITYKCAKCGEVLEVVELDAKGHTWDAGKVTKEATETEVGEKTYTCTVCGKTKTETIPKKQVVTPESPNTDTITTESLKKGDVVKDDKGRAKYKILDVAKREVAYNEPVNKKAKTVSILATVKIKGVTYKVTGIADNAFKGNKKVTKVTISSKVKTIGKQAFYGCKKLKTITIKSTKLTSKTVSKNAFKGLTKVTTIKVPKKKLKAYKKLFKSKGLSNKVKVKGY